MDISLSKFFDIAAVISIALAFGLLAYAYGNAGSQDKLTECAKANNVYKCEFIAVPVEKDDE